MKINPLSDLHQEFGLYHVTCDADVICLNGDIDAYKRPEAILPFLKHARYVFMVMGNHDLWGHMSIEESKANWKSLENYVNSQAKSFGLKGQLKIFTDFDTVEVDGIVFAGCTLWTKINPGDEMMLEKSTNDFEMIPNFTHQTWTDLNNKDFTALQDFLMNNDQKKVVMTHHCPSFMSIGENFQGNPKNIAYASNYDNLIGYYGPVLWMHGHVHNSVNYTLGDTNVICNPKGYEGHHLNKNFNPNLIVEI